MHTATYDVAVASWMGSVLTDTSEGSGFPAWVGATWDKAAVLRYGENPHQPAALYRSGCGPGLAAAEQLHGKEMSYNNYVDTDAARRAAYDFDEPAVAIIKHANPCGIAVGADVAEAHRRAHECDPVSAFGGVIAANRPVSVAMAEQVAEVFTEVIVAPGVRRGRGRGAAAQEEHPDPGLPADAAGRRRDPADQRRAADAAPRPGRRARRRPGHLDARDRGGGLGRGARRPGVRVEGLPAREVQRDPARPRRRLGRRRHGPGQPGRLVPARGRRGRGTGRRARWPPPTRSSRSRTARRS